MSKFLTEDQLKQAAEELEIPVERVKALYERSIASGSPFTEKALKEEVREALKTTATNPGGANSTQKKKEPMMDGEEDMTDEEKAALLAEKKTAKKDLVETVGELTEDEFKELRSAIASERQNRDSIASIVSALSDEEFKELVSITDGESVKRGVETAEKQELVEILKRQQDMMETQTKAFQGLAAALTQTKETGKDNVTDAVAEFISQLPRNQASGLISERTKEENADVTINDDAIVARLKAIEEKIDKQSNVVDGGEFYSLFTSKELNRGRAQ